MRAPVAERRVAYQQVPVTAPETVLIGKDILELVSTAMYTDPLTLYREYIQNAADAIDFAVQEGLLGSKAAGRIEVRVDAAAREARIRDNGSGVPAATAPHVLSAFGASGKRGGNVRGFRGIGRLAALGFCQALTFITKSHGESVATEVRWDCRKLRRLLRDPHYRGTLPDIVREVVTIRTHPSDNPAEHYFEVHLQQVVRTRRDALLNEDVIRRYLAQVAPVPLAPDFPFALEISAFLGEYLPTGHFEIFVGDTHSALVRPHRSGIQVTPSKRDDYVDWEQVIFQDPDLQTPAAVGWVAHHNYLGAISAEPEVSGLRARIGDIQVGSADLFVEIFAEARFNSWVIGELHVLDPRVVPNGRRDAFEQHPAVASLYNQLGPLGRRLTIRTRESSKARARAKGFDGTVARTNAVLTTLEEGLVRGAAAQSLIEQLGADLPAMENLLRADLLLTDSASGRPAQLAALRERYTKVCSADQENLHPLQHLSATERDFFDRIMGILFECVDDAAVGHSLLEQVTRRVAAR